MAQVKTKQIKTHTQNNCVFHITQQKIISVLNKTRKEQKLTTQVKTIYDKINLNQETEDTKGVPTKQDLNKLKNFYKVLKNINTKENAEY